MYEDYSKNELISIIASKNWTIEDLESRIRTLEIELDSANFKIKHELDPRIQREKRAYDNYITSSNY